jgi:mannose-binding lectin 2
VAYHGPVAGSNKPPPRAIPGLAFFSFLAGLLKWLVLVVIVVVAVIVFRGWKAKKDQKRF